MLSKMYGSDVIKLNFPLKWDKVEKNQVEGNYIRKKA